MKVQGNTNYVMQSGDTNLILKDFQIIDESGKAETPDDFINRVYPNFNLRVFLKSIDDALSVMHEGQPLTKKVRYNTTSYKLIIEYFHKDLELYFQRDFYHESNKKIVDHSYFKLPKSFRNQGKSKPIFKESLQQYINIDISLIRIHAALEDGGLVWGKFGFIATEKNEVTNVLNYAESILGKNSEDFKNVKNIYEVYYKKNPYGKSFPMILWANMSFMEKVLQGSHWHGELDLKNREQYLNFESKCI
jgi:hypothetical protein